MVKLFNLDLHIAVISDVKRILTDIYKDQIEIVDWSISGHSWLCDRKPEIVDIINQHTWTKINDQMIQEFVDKYHTFLSQFDGFIVTHSPVFCLLYESFGKPILLINSCRYEQPFSWDPNNNLEMWDKLNHKLERMWNTNQLIAISNNKADYEYLKLGTGIESTIIPILCLYTNAHYSPTSDKFVISSNHTLQETPKVVNKKNFVTENYKWSDLYKCRGIIHLPYEISTMSIFEQYSACVPLFFPSKELLKKIIVENNYPMQCRYNRIWNTNCKYHPKLDIALNDKTWIDFWIDRADYYDPEILKHVTYYNSIAEIYNIVENIDTEKISTQMIAHNIIRKETIYRQWQVIIDKVYFV